MEDKELRRIVNNVAVNPDGYKFLKVLLEKLGAFERGINYQDERMDFANRVKREQGLWLTDLMLKSNPEKYIKILNERENNDK